MQPLITKAEGLVLNKDEDDLDIYLEEEDNELDELPRYLEERRSNKQVSYYILIFILI